MKTKKLIKDALEFPIIVVASLWQKSEAMHMYVCSSIYITVRLGVFHKDDDAWWRGE
jgi:hypothetical protein